MIELDEVQQLRDDALIERLSLSVRNDRRVAVRLLVEIGEVMERKLYRELGFSSMFEFATRRLGMSEAEAVLRIRAAKVGRSFPVALEMLGRCEVNLTTLSVLSSVLTQDSLHLLYAARHKSKHEVLALIATHRPQPDAPDSVRRLPPPRTSARARRIDTTQTASVGLSDVQASTNPSGSGATTHQAAMQQVTPPQISAFKPLQTAEPGSPQTPEPKPPQTPEPTLSRSSELTRPQPPEPTLSRSSEPTLSRSSEPTLSRSSESALPRSPEHTTHPEPRTTHQPPPSAATMRQLSADRHRISFTASQRVRDLLQEAQNLRRHREPGADLEPLFERALELLVAEEKKRKFALTAKTGVAAKRPATNGRYISHALRRQVWTRDAGQCCFVAADGLRCTARSRLEFHHVVPFARGGPTSADNLVLLCRAHNALHAERDYGEAFVRERMARRAAGEITAAGTSRVSGNVAREISEARSRPHDAYSAPQQARAP